MATTPMRIFLSYGHDEHAELVRRIKNDLRNIGFEVWMDEDGIKPTNDWQVAIEIGLETTNSVIILMTPHSIRRPDGVCLDELAYARFKGKQIIPIMVKFIEPPLCISRLQWLDMQNWQDAIKGGIRESWYNQQFITLVKAIKGELALGFEGQQATLLQFLQPIDFGTNIEKYIQGFIGRKWVFDKFNSWLLNKGSSRIFLLFADAGFGKSAISAMLAHNNPSVVGIHFCQYQDHLRSDPRRIMLTLAYQLSTQLPEYRSYLLNLKLNDIEYDFKDSLISLFDILFLKPLRHIKSDRPLVFVIDALDELTKFTEQGTPFLSLLTDGFTRLPEWFGLMVTSRPDPELLRRMKSLDPLILQADNESNINDLLQFTREKLRNMGLSPSADIIGNLVNRSFGNILYLKETLAEVQKGRISIENIDSFPIGLSDYYSQFFDRQFSDKFRYRELVKPLLELLTVVNSPLPISLISQILEWDDYKLDDALLELGGLFPLENNCIRPFHKSVADWLVNPDLSGRSVRINGKYGAKKLIAKLWPDYEHDKRPFTEFINYLLPALLFNEEWDMLESILIDKRTPLLSTYVYVNRFPEKWDFTKIKKRIFDLNRFTWEKASEGIPTDNQELFQSFAVFMDIASHRTAPWFYELIQINSKAPNLPAFFKSSFSDIKCALHMNPIKVRTYYAVKKVLAKLVMLGIELPAKANQFLIELRKSSLYMDGSYLLNESPDPDILFRGFELMYQGDFIENDCLFNTMSLIIELDQGKADPSFVKKLLVYGADATATRKGISLDLYAENQGHIEVAKIIKKHLASKT